MFKVNPEVIFAYLTHHSDAITQWLCLATLLVVGAVVARTYFGQSETVGAGGWAGATDAEGLTRLEAALAKFTEQASRATPSATSDGSVGSEGDVNAEVTSLRETLRIRDEEVATLRLSPASVSVGGEPSDLAVRFEALQAKLAEYEILEDDIADLSLYRDENAKLKQELSDLKSAPPPAAPAPVAVAPEAAPAESVAPPVELPPTAPTPPVVVSAVSAVSAAAASAAEAASALMSEFDSPFAPTSVAESPIAEPVVEPIPEISSEAPTEIQAAPEPAAAEVVASAPGEQAPAEDLFAEFAPPPGETPVAAPAEPKRD